MKALLTLWFFVVSMTLSAESYFYTITAHPYYFSTDFEMQGRESYEGRVTKEALSVHTVYDLYDAAGEEWGQGVCRILSLGSLFSWAREVDLYDAAGNGMGKFVGVFLTTAQAAYQLYDGANVYLGTAYLDTAGSGFSIHNTQGRVIALLQKNQEGWEVTLYDTKALDRRMLHVFSAFVVDHQDCFKPHA